MSNEVTTNQFKQRMKKAGNVLLMSAGKLGNQRHLVCIRDAFALFTPFIIAGGLAILVRSFVFGGVGNNAEVSILGWIAKAFGGTHEVVDPSGGTVVQFVPGSTFAQVSYIGNFIFYGVSHATIDAVSLYMAFGVGYIFAKIKKHETPVISGFVSLGSFLVATLAKPNLFDANGLVTALVVGFFSAEVFNVLSRTKKLMLKMPEGVPPAVAKSFAQMFPIIIILTGIVLINAPFVIIGTLKHIAPGAVASGDPGMWTLGDALFYGIQSPFLAFAGDQSAGLGIALIYVTAGIVLWFFGIHGSNVLNGVFYPIWLALYTQNVGGAHHIFVFGTFDAFVWIGGGGATNALLLAVFFFSRKVEERQIMKIGFAPGIFQINEPVLFGFPLMLNVKYVVPFIFTTPILVITTYLGFTWFSIHPVTVLVPWTVPFGVSSLLATAMDWKAFILAVINFGIAFAMYTPWVLLWTRKHKEASSGEGGGIFQHHLDPTKTAEIATPISKTLEFAGKVTAPKKGGKA